MKKIIIILSVVLVKVNYGQDLPLFEADKMAKLEKDFAEYGISGALSPFGISLSMSYNKSCLLYTSDSADES